MGTTDKRLKYLDMPREFKARAQDVELSCKMSQRMCEEIAKRLARTKPKTADEFERVEKWKELVMTTSQANEKMMSMLDFTHKFLQEIASDAKELIDGAELRNKLEIQSETIEILMSQTATMRKVRDEIGI